MGYTLRGQRVDVLPAGADDVAACEPMYEEMPGWSESTFGVKSFDALPQNARNYLKRLEALCGVPLALVSTGPDRDETIVIHHPFKS